MYPQAKAYAQNKREALLNEHTKQDKKEMS